MLASSSKLWDTEQGKAIDFGNLLHEIFSKIITKSDVDDSIYQYLQQGILNEDQWNIGRFLHLNNLVENKEMHLFNW